MKKIAYITFAKKAAKEGKERLGYLSSGNFIGTYDSFLLNEIIPFIKNNSNYKLLNIKYSFSKNILKSFEHGVRIFKKTGEICAYKNSISGLHFLSQLALSILKKMVNARNYLISKYFHICNDEAQDYNISQINLLEFIFLTLNIPMTFVGDFNQSIYEFRGAKPWEVKEFLNKIHIKNYALTSNFRCHESIQSYSQHFLFNTDHFPIKENKVILYKYKDLKLQEEDIIWNIVDIYGPLTILRRSIRPIPDNFLSKFERVKPLSYETDSDFPDWCGDLILYYIM